MKEQKVRNNMSLREECSLNNSEKLRNLIVKNPELPLLIFCGEDAWDGEHMYTQGTCSKGEITELTLYEDAWLDVEQYEEKLEDDLYYEDEYKNLSNEEFEKMIAEKVDKTEFVKAIVVYVG